ncbi:hypothetical protein [Kaistia terrae]|uniref:Uncharacterized protein n=1 Tax=Kaistia terrae TaxID=537017 RepID=A0ABW0PTU5_9HYPH|nr:hypothetical protein [Kaistia terrae]MCX5577234.1 hypothetical protein [Kaistia terrae]
MPAPATKDDLKASLADLNALFALQVRKLTVRFALMMLAFVAIVYVLHVSS